LIRSATSSTAGADMGLVHVKMMNGNDFFLFCLSRIENN